MELVKKNVHMDYTKAMASTQFVLEEDINLSDTKPDMDFVCLEKGQVVVEEVKAYEDAVVGRGRLQFAVLYHSDEENKSLAVMSSTCASLKITSMETPTFPSSIALIWLRSISTNSASCNWVKRLRLR